MKEIENALYVVGTPIGNLEDFSPRGREVLAAVDFIAAEDTRVTMKLLNKFEIKKPLISYFEHNKAFRGEQIIARIKAGESCALVSDAGMPAISDPGETLVAACAEQNIAVYTVPGPTAALSALAVSGLPTGRFTFEGFLSMNKRHRSEHLHSLEHEERTMIFYEAPHKLPKTLRDMRKVFGGERRISLCRELTKLHEEIIRTDIDSAEKLYKQKEPKGEYVLVIEGGQKLQKEEMQLDEAIAYAKELVESGTAKSEAAKLAAQESGQPRAEIYKAMNN